MMLWVKERLRECSTYRGLLGLILAAIGLSHGESERVVDAVLVLFGVLSAHAAATAERRGGV